MGLENDLFLFLKIPGFYLLQDGSIYIYTYTHLFIYLYIHTYTSICLCIYTYMYEIERFWAAWVLSGSVKICSPDGRLDSVTGAPRIRVFSSRLRGAVARTFGGVVR